MERIFLEKIKELGAAKRAVFLDEKFLEKEIILDEKDNDNFFCEIKNNKNFDEVYQLIKDFKKSGIIKTSSEEIYVENISLRPRLIILGGGHISLPLSIIAKFCDFEVIVIDDREEFANTKRFSGVDRVICCKFEDMYRNIFPQENDYYVILTRGHVDDEKCLEEILQKGKYKYLGMIGSKIKVQETFVSLKKKGYSEEKLSGIFAPIGLKIGGQLPGEIAVSIGAQLVQEKNKNYNETFDREILKEILNNNSSGVLCTIIKKEGSSPRGVGSKIFIRKDNKIFGTIGGGSLEYNIIKIAPNIKKPTIMDFNLSNEESSTLGMICGGKIKVLFEVI